MAKTVKMRNRRTGKAVEITRVKAGEMYLGALVSLASLADKLEIPGPVVGALLLVMRDSIPALPVESLIAVYERLGPVKGKLSRPSRDLLSLLKAAAPLDARKPPARRATNARRRSTVGAETPRQAAGRRR